MGEIVIMQPEVEDVPNNPAHEFLFDACDGHGKARQRRLIHRAMLAGFVDRGDAEIVADALGVEL